MIREFHPGMGQAVAERTIIRKVPDYDVVDRLTCVTVSSDDPMHDLIRKHVLDQGRMFATDHDNTVVHFPFKVENWGDVAARVAEGNTSLIPQGQIDHAAFRRHLETATILMSGRHLQHGDKDQASRNLEVFTNCSTSAASFLLFYLLLNGSGVGRSYDDDMMIVDWDNMPTVRCVLEEGHPDFQFGAMESTRDAQHKYGSGDSVHWFKVPDSREGWAEAIEQIEIMAFQKAYRDELLILDFSEVRGKGSAIGGMQNRPSSGPVPLMEAIARLATLKGGGLPRWLQAMYVDHYLAEVVLVGGARRAARMAVKHWADKTSVAFARIKRPIEFDGLSREEVEEYRKTDKPFSFLWSSNNSIGVDADFWRRLKLTPDDPNYNSELTRRAREVFQVCTECSYGDGTGEPGFINLDQLTQKDEGMEELLSSGFVGSDRYDVTDETKIFLSALAKKAVKKKLHTIVNPCGEIPLSIWGGYCVIADTVPFHAETLEEAEDAMRHAARALIRTNTMDALYGPETKRTNRIGVGQTGVHEFAWKFFEVGFQSLVTPNFAGFHELSDPEQSRFTNASRLRLHEDRGIRAAAFWEIQGCFSRSVIEESNAYSDEIGVNRPHTKLTIKPAGTTSKLFGLTEGWHLASMMEFLRWVQFRHDDPLVAEYQAQGYPTRELKTYSGTTIVGFPTAPVITTLGMGDELVLAGDASPEDQYKWLQLGEFFWIEGGSVGDYLAGGEARPGQQREGGQISYTLKYKPDQVSYEAFCEALMEGQQVVRACSVMPQEGDDSSYEYLPEQAVSKAEFEAVIRGIKKQIDEDIGLEHVDCAGGACPIDFKTAA